MLNIDKKQAEALVSGIDIPPRPVVVHTVMEEQMAEYPNLGRVVDAISHDVSLTASILKAVNSPLYGLRSKISSIQHGVTMLGFKNVCNLVTGLALKQAIKGARKLKLEQFWDNASDTAIVARALSLELQAGDPDDAYLFGLFHDCGIPLLMLKFPDYKEVVGDPNTYREISLTTLEDEALSTNHAVLGYFVARTWRVPDHICEAILNHHEDDMRSEADANVKPLLNLLPLAMHICHRTRTLTEDYEWLRVSDDVLSYFELDMDQYQELVADMGERLEV